METFSLTRDIVVSDSIFHHSANVALAIQEMGRLRYMVTSFFYKDRLFPYSAFRRHKRTDAYLRRRYRPELDQKVIRNVPFYEAVEQVFRTVLGNKPIVEMLTHWRERAFDSHVCLCGIDESVRVFIGYPNACYCSFRKVKHRSGLCILDVPLGHFREAINLLSEEKELCPDFADSITDADFDEKYQSRVDAELEMADYIVVASEFTRSTLLKHGVKREKIVIIRHGSYLEPIEESAIVRSERRTLRVLFTGQLGQRKGIKYLLEAVKLLKEEGLDISLTLVGHIYGSGRGLKRYASLYEYVPFVRRHELREIYLRHDVFVFPSLFEGFGLVVLEALACGLPVITTPHIGDLIVDGENGYVVPIRDVEAIANKLRLFYYNRDLLFKMGHKAVESSRSFTWEEARRRWKEFLHEVGV